ncbi:RIP metalloprotease RseP [Mechercharimyces sp. CAU 1602]|uniref:RIP metalloprotease RseP n=1 Tax=Mechercharimyces sp. CAU 1602 TaxID=2973933 RepID=UPI002161B1AC|nr:RIP metalloprotease RseP [Mechercharimyces sp. CAU 1602]MCS1351297.1 RIP metalloprotease RseP [Mechercharimyces sp. CAU 1602]
MQTVLSFVLVIGVLVFIHELGHFLFAKRAGILVREFAIGMGPKLVAWKKGETLYSLRILPIGGYVRMAGEDPEVMELKNGSPVTLTLDQEGKVTRISLLKQVVDPTAVVRGRLTEYEIEHHLYVVLEDEEGKETRYAVHPQAEIQFAENQVVQIAPWDRQFGSKTLGQRAMTIFAGPLFNIILAVIFYAIVSLTVGVESEITIKKVQPDTPAAAAELQAGDIIREADGNPYRAFADFRFHLIEQGGSPVELTVERDGELKTLTVDPIKQDDFFIIGVELEQGMKEAGLLTAVSEGFKDTYRMTLTVIKSFGMLITGQISFDNLAGPVGIASISGQAAEAGWVSLINFAAMLSVNLGMLNLFPIPALDGSRLIFLGLEGIRRKPIDPNKESMVHFVGFALLMIFMIAVTYNDIMRLFSVNG